ncbi:OmpH family outer membrane protein [Lichenicoccus sp.]|uniref:OmpH family outer membrane protein n=1 Tax=Lichenicoccus sp. TaxID=2781899 RepID=UPI003D0E980C
MSRSQGLSTVPAIAFASLALCVAAGAHAQSNSQHSGSGWFVPKTHESAPEAVRRQSPSSAPITDPAADRADAQGGDAQGGSQEAPRTPPVLPLPPIPALTAIKKGEAPPGAVIGVLSVQDVMRASTAAQEVQRVLGARRDALNADAQKEQASWREIQQQIQNSKGSPEKLQARERALQQRVLKAQRDFRNRNRILQEAAQVSLGQVERELVQVIRQVAAARGMNLVLHREQVALNVNGFDITQQVTAQLNASLSSVFIPGDGVDPEQLAKSGAFPTTANPGPQPSEPPVEQASANASAPKH